ncbi:hypothetical protein [Benzoatithermus flavus]|uniref:Uncharacterized protein n=1 Tax=Benzoatithermus flavus TaxID=3108223 RepID=A0ABU8XY09_9PROT
MFPYRRNGPKKRGKGGGGRRHHEGGGNGAGRRVPGSAAELLPMLQPTTKALAQVLAGNTKMSGQLVHARNILAQANRLVDERMVDRLPPAQREEFFEQLARLKLTIADAEEAGLSPEPRTEVQVKPVEVVGVDRLREVALRLAAASATPEPGPLPPPPLQVAQIMEQEQEEQRAAARASLADEGAEERENGARPRLRLRVSRSADEPAMAGGTTPAAGTGPRRERLRLKPLRQVASDADG